ncbi:hypothetical protein ACR6C2_26925 [Streptomyces sp. INA 01156]
MTFPPLRLTYNPRAVEPRDKNLSLVPYITQRAGRTRRRTTSSSRATPPARGCTTRTRTPGPRSAGRALGMVRVESR